MGNHLFVFFAVLDVSGAVNSCINHRFFYIYNSNTANSVSVSLTTFTSVTTAIAAAARPTRIQQLTVLGLLGRNKTLGYMHASVSH